MKTWILLLMIASAAGKIWTIQSFKESCLPNEKNLKVTVTGKRTHLECRSQGVEVKSAWFDKDPSKKDQLTGSLERTLNSSQVVTMDQDFDASGNLKVKKYYIQAETKDGQRIQNMFVFDGSGKLVNGNIVLPGESFVIPMPGMVLLNGQPIEKDGIEILSTKLKKKYGITAQSSFPELIEAIWQMENSKPSPSDSKPISPATTK